jgi:hypothetical protein
MSNATSELHAELTRDGVLFPADRRTIGYSHLATCLQQGFAALGIPCHTLPSELGEVTIDQRPVAPDFRLSAAIPPANAALTVIDVTNLPATFYRHPSLPALLGGLKARRLLLISQSDENSDFWNDLVVQGSRVTLLATSENENFRPPGKRLPWAFGLSQAIIDRVQPRSDRPHGILRNFRPSLSQDVRAMLDLVLLPHLARDFIIDRHLDGAGHAQDGHFARLAASEACFAYGGALREDVSRNPAFGIVTQATPFLAEPVILRWDSWRFWEALASGCTAIHLDLERYGLMLPVMPEPWVHYVPIDLADPRATAERIVAERGRLPEIGAAGRQWALAHYAPRPTAERLIRTVTELGL